MNEGKEGMANMHIACVSSVSAYDPLSFTKHKFKEKIIKHFEIIEDHLKCRSQPGAGLSDHAQAACP